MKKVIVTGGAGFIGSHTSVELFNAGYLPVIVDHFGASAPYQTLFTEFGITSDAVVTAARESLAAARGEAS